MQLEEVSWIVNQSIEMHSKMLELSPQEIKERLIEEWTIDEEEDKLQDVKITADQLCCIQSYLNKMILCHGERVKFYQHFFEDPQIESTKDLSKIQAGRLIHKIQSEPDQLESQIANILGWKELCN